MLLMMMMMMSMVEGRRNKHVLVSWPRVPLESSLLLLEDSISKGAV